MDFRSISFRLLYFRTDSILTGLCFFPYFPIGFPLLSLLPVLSVHLLFCGHYYCIWLIITLPVSAPFIGLFPKVCNVEPSTFVKSSHFSSYLCLENLSLICSSHVPLISFNIMEAPGSDGIISSPPSTYDLSHLGLVYFLLLGALKKVASHTGYICP